MLNPVKAKLYFSPSLNPISNHLGLLINPLVISLRIGLYEPYTQDITESHRKINLMSTVIKSGVKDLAD